MTSNMSIAALVDELLYCEQAITAARQNRDAKKEELIRHLIGRAHMQGQIAAFQYVAQLSPAMEDILAPRVRKLQERIGPI